MEKKSKKKEKSQSPLKENKKSVKVKSSASQKQDMKIEKEDRKSPNKKGNKNNKENEDKKKEEATDKKVKFDLDFIYRREKYTLKNLLSNLLICGVKRLISKKLSIDLKELKFYYKDKEMKDDKLNIYEMVKADNFFYIEVKKESGNSKDIISMNTKVNLVYKVKCTNITNYIDLNEKIEKFFRDLCLESHFLCEPTSLTTYEIGLSCKDHCFQFKRYMMTLQRTDKLYEKSTVEILPVDKNKIITPQVERVTTDIKKKNDFPDGFINVGPYITFEDIKKKDEKEGKKKWMDKKGFSVV